MGKPSLESTAYIAVNLESLSWFKMIADVKSLNSGHKACYLSTYKTAISVCVAVITFLYSVVRILPILTSFDRSGNSYLYSRVRSLIELSETGYVAACSAMGLYSDWPGSWYRSSDSDSPAGVTGSGFCLGVTSSELNSESPKS